MASQEAAAVQRAKESLESQAKEAQDRVGGGNDKSSVVSAQVVVPSKLGEKADEVLIVPSVGALLKVSVFFLGVNVVNLLLNS